jgi:hypothetical protein
VRTAAVLLTTVVCVACARGGSEDRSDTVGLAADSGQPTAGGDTATPTPAVSDPGTKLPAPVGGTSTAPSKAPPRRPSGTRPSGTPPPTPTVSPPAAGSDTARGIVAVVGAVPITEVVLRPATGRPITLTGPLAREIGVASGADVWVRGRRVDSRTIDVASYAVRSVDGVTAITGTLAADGDRLVLVTDDGRRHLIARPPAPLRQHVGARVWITGDLATTINAYGVLRPRR